MTTRRHFLATGAAALATPLVGTAATAQAFQIPPHQQPRYVTLSANLPANEIHVIPADFALYWTLPDGRAIRYAVGIGRAGLYHSGEYYVGAKREWPTWTPTPEMIERDPDAYLQFEEGMPGGPSNPLGARAIYLFDRRGDTYLRIHGTNLPRTIGTAVSNGCVRLVNQYISDLYPRVPLNSRVVLHDR